MIEHIVREAVPALRAYQEQPTPQRFKMAMQGLQEVLNEDEKHTGSHGAWSQFAHFSPPVTKVVLQSWINTMPAEGPKIVAGILLQLQKLGIDLRPSGKVPPPAAAPAPVPLPSAGSAQASFDAVFGNPVTSVAAANAARAMAHSQFNTTGPPVPSGGYAGAVQPQVATVPSLQERMERTPYQDLMDAALRWQVDTTSPPLQFARFLQATRDRLPPDALERIMGPLGVGHAYFHAWCLAAQGQAPAGTQWPDAAFQYRVMRQYLGFFTLVELNAQLTQPQQLAYRLFAVGTLLPREEQQRACLAIQQRAPSAGAWVYVTPEVLGAWASGMAQAPQDSAMLNTMRAVLADLVYLRFRAAAW